MSSGKLDQSLDDIVKTNRPRRTRRVVQKNVAPAGGISKKGRQVKQNKTTTRAAQAAAKNKPAIPVPSNGESKIVVSGLPSDVTEQQIKEYFGKTVGAVKRAMLTYGPNGQSRGVATIIFNKPGSAVEAANNLNGVKVDGRSMKIEVIVGATQAPVAVPAKGLGDRIAQPKNQPKKVEAKKATKATAKSATKAGGKKGKAVKAKGNGRGRPKTADELDAEMTDYFGPAANGTAGQSNAAVNGNATGDTGMEDEIM